MRSFRFSLAAPAVFAALEVIGARRVAIKPANVKITLVEAVFAK